MKNIDWLSVWGEITELRGEPKTLKPNQSEPRKERLDSKLFWGIHQPEIYFLLYYKYKNQRRGEAARPCPEQWSDTFGSHICVKRSAKVSDNMRETALNVAQRWPEEASCFKCILQREKKKTAFCSPQTPKARWLLKWSDDKRLIWSLIQGKGSALQAWSQKNTRRKQRLVNSAALNRCWGDGFLRFSEGISGEIPAPRTYVWLGSMCQSWIRGDAFLISTSLF